MIRHEERTFELDPGEVASARRFVAGVLHKWGCSADDMVLVVGELAANAVLHARTRFTVAVNCDDDRLTIEVADYNPRLPSATEPPKGALSGRGLLLVAAVSKAWGIRPQALDGKLIWAELDATSTSTGRP